MMDLLAKERDHQDRMSTPIAYTTMTIDEALGYNTAIHATGQGLLDGWLGILSNRGGATPVLIGFSGNNDQYAIQSNRIAHIPGWGQAHSAYDTGYSYGDNTPHFLYHIPNFTMITDIDGKARANYTMYGQFPQSHGSTPSIYNY